MSKLMYDIQIDFADAIGWECPFCGGEIDHLCQDDYPDLGYNEDSYNCQEPKGYMCENAYMVVRWSRSKRGDNGDALTLKRYITVSVEKKHINEDED